MKFHRKLQTESLKDKFYIQKNMSKVKVIGVKESIKNGYFGALSRYLQKLSTDSNDISQEVAE